MSDYFDKALHYLGKRGEKLFTLNIGSMDGVMFDELCGYSRVYGFKGLYVEPISYLFERLKKNIGNDNLFENSAISDYNGEIEMIMIDQEAIDKNIVDQCFYGMSAVYPPKNCLGREGDKQTVEKYGVKIKVPCITLETLLKKHSIQCVDVIKMDTEGHDYIIFRQIDFARYKPKVVRLEWINLTESEQKFVIDTFEKNHYVYNMSSQDIMAIPQSLADEIELANLRTGKINEDCKTIEITINTNQSVKSPTLVTGLWDIKRSDLTIGWSRTYQDYLDHFEKLLTVDTNMIIFGNKDLEDFVWKHRCPNNTQFILRDVDWFKNNNYYDLIQKIRTNPIWYDQSAKWLKDSTQAKLEMYNPLVMSKMFLLNDARILDKFDSEYMFWIDGGITRTVNISYFTRDKVLYKLPKYILNFTFVAFPYTTTTEIHGFEYNKLCDYAANDNVNLVGRGGFFGGDKNMIEGMNSIYYNLLMETLNNGLMGTEESIFSIILYRHFNSANYVEILNNGLLCKFFEDLKNDTINVKSINSCNNLLLKRLVDIKTHLYILTFNFPSQVEALLKSFQKADNNFLSKPIKFLLNNSTDRTTDDEYDEICKKYGLEQIKKNNIGICGGRQFIAEHFDNSDADYYIFFEDDMMLYENKQEIYPFCKNGFRTWIPNLYNRSLEIIHKENYDFLKLNFTEIYGDNSTQWAWYNVPDNVRIKYFPTKPKKPIHGFDPNPPLTSFTCIKKSNDLAYIEGEIFYCNWPLWFSKKGNYKTFIETKFAFPYEQTMMSHVYQKQKQNLFNTAILLLSPINHNRIHFYQTHERKEN